MLLPLQGESAILYSQPRAPLRSALGYEQVAPSGRAGGILHQYLSPNETEFPEKRTTSVITETKEHSSGSTP